MCASRVRQARRHGRAQLGHRHVVRVAQGEGDTHARLELGQTQQSGVCRAVGYVRLGRTGQSDRTEDGEDQRRRRRSMRADGVRILWRGNTWRMPEGCIFQHGNGAELIQGGVHMRS